jgi:pimeloyl-ACP methyl ester carboxylesterase
MNIPPFQLFADNLFSYSQIKRSFYFWFFQMQEVIEDLISANNFAFIDNIWADWSPGYDAQEDLPHVKECLRDRPHLETALGYYWGQFDPVRFGSPTWVEEQRAAWGGAVRHPVLYLHGTNDGCHGLNAQQVAGVPSYLGEGSRSELIEAVGHFMMVERPDEINEKIVGFLRR